MENILALRLFVLVARTGSFSAAGRVMGLSPASVLRYMNHLEDETRSSLFHRSSRKITLTEVGELLLERATSIIRDIDALRSSMLEVNSGPRGTLNIHARVSTGTELVVPVMAAFREAHPEVTLNLTLSDDGEVNISQRNVDLWITTHLPAATSLVSRKLASCPRLLCASPAYFARKAPPRVPQDLVEHDCITFQFDLGEPTWRFRNADGIQTVRPNAVVRTTSGRAMFSLALLGAGIAMLPEWFLAEEIRAGRLVRTLDSYDASSEAAGSFQAATWALYQRSRFESPKLRAFLDFMAAALRRRARDGWINPDDG